MTSQFEQTFLDELHLDAATQDLIKARMLMDHLADHSAEFQQAIFNELTMTEPEFQAPAMCFLLDHSDQLTGFGKEDLLAQLSQLITPQPELLTNLLSSDLVYSKSQLLPLCDALPSEQTGKLLLALLAETSANEDVCVLLSAIGELGYDAAVPALTEYLYANNREVVASAIGALGQTESIAAVDALAARVGADTQVDVLILQALTQMATSHAIAVLAKQLSAPSAFVRTRAKEHLQSLAAHAVPALAEALDQLDEDGQIHCLNVLGAIGDGLAVQPIRKLLHNEPANPNIRFAAYESLGMLPMTRGGYVLTNGLADPDPTVRVAAAAAIERNLDDHLGAGLTNLTRKATDETHAIARAMADALADQSVMLLSDGYAFCDMLVAYLNHEAHPDIFAHYQALFDRNGRTDLLDMLARSIDDNAAPQTATLFAVDDSRMILGIYKTQLYELGYEVELFEFPAMALERLSEVVPQAVFTDLNMPEIDGIELTRAMREQLGERTPPIFLVTTQTAGGDADAALAAGVSSILKKPFAACDLESLLQAHDIQPKA